MYRQYFKNLLDFIYAIIIFVLLSPIFVLIFFTVISTMGRPCFFLQKRIGLNEKSFTIYKFRTMSSDKNKDGCLLPDKDRLTKLGKFLRSTSLDEIPSFLNVIKGDMSIVGPRPLLVQYLPLYSEPQRERHSVKPGLTGYAQINGRNSVKWCERFQFDIDYVKNVSFVFDMKILLKTIYVVLRRNGVDANVNTTMEYFKGDNY